MRTYYGYIEVIRRLEQHFEAADTTAALIHMHQLVENAARSDVAEVKIHVEPEVERSSDLTSQQMLVEAIGLIEDVEGSLTDEEETTEANMLLTARLILRWLVNQKSLDDLRVAKFLLTQALEEDIND